MPLSEQLNTDLRQAMVSGDTRRRDVIRFLRASLTNAAIEKRRDLTDDEILAVIRTQIKQRRDSIDMFRKGGREELAEEEEQQIAVLLAYLPQQLSNDELAALVTRVADSIEARSMRDMSRLMAQLTREVDGRAEGRAVSHAARAELDRRSI